MTTMMKVDLKTGVTYRTVLLQAAEEVRKRGHCADRGLGRR
jgi:hypothetical protein